MSDVRFAAWAKKVGKSPALAPKLQALPPTTESFQETVKRAHYQTCVWTLIHHSLIHWNTDGLKMKDKVIAPHYGAYGSTDGPAGNTETDKVFM